MSSPDQALGPGREFDLVRALRERWGPLARGLGGDCAELDLPPGERLVVSTDTSVEDVHFRAAWLSPREIAYRACAAALSDLAAAGAHPLGMLVALALPARWLPHANQLADGIGEAARTAGTSVVGGDTTSAAQLTLGITVLASAARPLRRDGARPGDLLWVTGALGGPAAALRAWLAGHEPAPHHRARFAHPEPRLAAGRWLAAHGATAAIDLSDGLAADARHLAAASGVVLELDVERLPLVRGVTAAEALASGEEYELLLSAPRSLDAGAFTRHTGVPLTAIGRVTAADADGAGVRARVDLPAGYDHLSR